ncbi:MAG: hypothetical protein JWR42_1557 [Marmoricola sp.]|nr:hypothetical protein [Marmoricola sp.]
MRTPAPAPSSTIADPSALRSAAVKVPAVTAMFWLVKILTTGMGEAASDWLVSISIVLPVVIGLGGLLLTLRRQLRAPAYDAVTYWSAVAMVAVFGTVAADAVHVVGIPLQLTTAGYAVAVAVILSWWHRSEGTLSVHSVVGGRRELFYWGTVLATFALGTAAGDLTAFVLHLGYLWSAVLFGVAILVPWILHRVGLLGEVGAFWTAYVLTRPLGASFADWLGKAKLGGLGYGDGVVTLGSLLLIVALVARIARVERSR